MRPRHNPARQSAAVLAAKIPLRRVTISLRFRERLVTRADERMSWLTWSNPVAIWWMFLLAVSAVNVVLFLGLRALYRRFFAERRMSLVAAEPLLLLSAVYVFVCAFRSMLPRADVQRICLFDTPLSSVLVGRLVATIAELFFIIQWAIVLRELAKCVGSDTARNVSRTIVPLIVLAECCSWYAVITTNFLGNVLENSLWTASFLLIAVALVRLLPHFRGIAQWAIAATALGVAGYLMFMVTVDVPMYFVRWQAQTASGYHFLGFAAGLHDLGTRWIVSHEIARWRHEIPWMTLYFSLAVWASLALGSFGLIRHQLTALSSAFAHALAARPGGHRGLAHPIKAAAPTERQRLACSRPLPPLTTTAPADFTAK